MPTPRRFDPRDLFGFTGKPLATTPALAGDVQKRFTDAGQGAFVPYIDPWQTLAGAQQYRQADNSLKIADAENAFVDEVGSGKTGLDQFMAANPIAGLSPMVQTYQRIHRPTKAEEDPYETPIAKEGADYLRAYRMARDSGQDPTEAYGEVMDHVRMKKEAGQKKQDDELFFVEKGGDLEDFGDLQAKGATRAQMLDFINKKGKPLTTSEAKKLAELQAEVDTALTSVDSYGEENKAQYVTDAKEAFSLKYPERPFTDSKQDWEDAYFALKDKRVGPKTKAHDDFIQILQENGKRIPAPRGAVKPAIVPAVPVAPTAAAPVTTVSPFDGGPVVVPAAEIPRKPGISPLAEVRKALKP